MCGCNIIQVVMDVTSEPRCHKKAGERRMYLKQGRRLSRLGFVHLTLQLVQRIYLPQTLLVPACNFSTRLPCIHAPYTLIIILKPHAAQPHDKGVHPPCTHAHDTLNSQTTRCPTTRQRRPPETATSACARTAVPSSGTGCRSRRFRRRSQRLHRWRPIQMPSVRRLGFSSWEGSLHFEAWMYRFACCVCIHVIIGLRRGLRRTRDACNNFTGEGQPPE